MLNFEGHILFSVQKVLSLNVYADDTSTSPLTFPSSVHLFYLFSSRTWAPPACPPCPSWSAVVSPALPCSSCCSSTLPSGGTGAPSFLFPASLHPRLCISLHLPFCRECSVDFINFQGPCYHPEMQFACVLRHCQDYNEL